MARPAITVRRRFLLVLVTGVALGVGLITTTGSAQAAGGDPSTPAGAAWAWIQGQRGSGTAVTSASVITRRAPTPPTGPARCPGRSPRTA